MVILAIILLFFYRQIAFEGKTFLIEDRVSGTLPSGPYGYSSPGAESSHARDTAAIAWGYEPSSKYFRDRLLQGEFALWKNNPGLGSPLVADGMSLPVDPLLGITYICPGRWWAVCMDLVVLLRFLLAGWFTYLFTRRLQLSFFPAVFAGAAFMFSYQIVIFGNSPQLPAQILIPALLWGFHLLADRPSISSLSIIALLIAWTIVSGLSEAAFLSLLMGGLWYLFKIFWLARADRPGAPSWINRLAWGAAASFAGLGLSAWFWIPLVENIASSVTTHPGGQGLRVFPPSTLVLTLVPPIEVNAMIPSFRTLVVTLAVAAVFALPRMKEKTWPAVFFGSYFLIFGLQQFGVVPFKWIGYLPGFYQITTAHYMTATVNFSLIVLSALGADHISRDRGWRPLLFSVLFQVVLLLTLNPLIRFAPDYSFASFLSRFGFISGMVLAAVLVYFILARTKKIHLLPAAYLALFLVEISVIHSGINYPQRYYPYMRPPFVSFLAQAQDDFRVMGFDQVLHPNVGMVYGIDDLRYLDAIDPQKRSHFFRALVSPSKFVDRLSGSEPGYASSIFRIFDLLNVRYILAGSDFQPALGVNLSAIYPLVYDAEVKVYENPGALPRAFILYRAEKSESQEWTLQRLAAPDFDPFSTALVESEHWASLQYDLPETPPEKWAAAQVTQRRANQIEIAAQSEYAGILVVSETYFPGWQAYLNGERVDIFPVDGMLRGISIPAGVHLVRFTYHPTSFILGVVLAGITILALTVSVLFSSQASRGFGSRRPMPHERVSPSSSSTRLPLSSIHRSRE